MDPSPVFDDVEQENTPRVNFFVNQRPYKTHVNVYLKQLRYTTQEQNLKHNATSWYGGRLNTKSCSVENV
jgi:hypothetical protein